MAQVLTRSELFESSARDAWNSEPYHLPTTDSWQSHPQYPLYDDVANGIDPRFIWSEPEGGEDVSYSEEDDDDDPHLSTGIAREHEYHQCLACHVRDYHACTCDDDIPTPARRPAAATACIASALATLMF
jgi:hypothetical protein